MKNIAVAIIILISSTMAANSERWVLDGFLKGYDDIVDYTWHPRIPNAVTTVNGRDAVSQFDLEADGLRDAYFKVLESFPDILDTASSKVISAIDRHGAYERKREACSFFATHGSRFEECRTYIEGRSNYNSLECQGHKLTKGEKKETYVLSRTVSRTEPPTLAEFGFLRSCAHSFVVIFDTLLN